MESSILHSHIEAERRRLRAHFAAVASELRAADITHLPPELACNRARNLERLDAYAARGLFPLNPVPNGSPVPIFRDAGGTHCAVAYLVDQAGHPEVVDQVQAADNFARVKDLREGPLLEWVDGSGFTQAEAARIQPNYGGPIFDPTPMLAATLAFASVLHVAGAAAMRRAYPEDVPPSRLHYARFAAVLMAVPMAGVAAMAMQGQSTVPCGMYCWWPVYYKGGLVTAAVVVLALVNLIPMPLYNRFWPRPVVPRLVVEFALNTLVIFIVVSVTQGYFIGGPGPY